MERLKHIKDTLMCCVEGQMGHLGTVDTQELGAAIDMIKDLEEAIYYCTITKAMHEQDKEMEMMKKHKKMNGNGEEMYYTEMNYPPYPYPMYDNGNSNGRAYANENGGRSNGNGNGNGRSYMDGNGNGGRQYYADGNNNYGNPRDNEKEGRSGRVRRQYMEGKEMHHDTATQMRELEKYMQELSSDVLEMIKEASPEERQFLSKKIATLATKVDALE